MTGIIGDDGINPVLAFLIYFILCTLRIKLNLNIKESNEFTKSNNKNNR